MEEKLIKVQIATQNEAAQSDPSILSEPLPPIKRHTRWSEGRKKKTGKFINKEVEAVAQRIVCSIY